MDNENNDFESEKTEQANSKLKTASKKTLTAEDRFLKDAEKIVNRTMKDMTAISELSIKHKGVYKEEHIEQIFKALRKKLENTRKSFKMQDEDDDSFSFGDEN